ncbi:unnamed protein product [Leuciscus chuanchicus]
MRHQPPPAGGGCLGMCWGCCMNSLIHSLIVFFIMTIIIISLLLLASLLPHLTFTAHVNGGIVNGREAKPHSRPYMVSIQVKRQHSFGGFLISDEFVLTAGHCRNKTEELTVVVGAHNLPEMNVHINVKSYYKHPDYSEKPFRNDIMLLRLEKKVEKNKNVEWISIPKTEEDIAADSVCSVAGWGRLVTNGTASLVLMETNVKIMNNKKCENSWGSNFWFERCWPVSAVRYQTGACHGDSGGPLVCGDTAVGVTSFGDIYHCNSHEYPEVYLKISASHVNVGIVNGNEVKRQHSFGGFLISDEFVLTAGHCRMKTEELTVVVGAHNLREMNVRINVKSYYKHPDYSEKPFLNDIMLLRLEKKVEKNENVEWISIPKTEEDIAADSVCSVAGWGSLVTNGTASPVLMETNVKIMNNKKCENSWGSTYSAAQMMCVYGHGGSCDGDSGGPLVCGDTAVGVTSFGWGRLNINGSLSSRLMETNVKIINNTNCENKWGENNYSASQMMCTYGDGGSCTGDSGGPLVCGDTAVGVTSFGDPDLCNSPKLPEVYMKTRETSLPRCTSLNLRRGQERTSPQSLSPFESDQVRKPATPRIAEGGLVEFRAWEDSPVHFPTAECEYELASGSYFDELKDIFEEFQVSPASPVFPEFPPRLPLPPPQSASSSAPPPLLSFSPSTSPTCCKDLSSVFRPPAPSSTEEPLSPTPASVPIAPPGLLPPSAPPEIIGHTASLGSLAPPALLQGMGK